MSTLTAPVPLDAPFRRLHTPLLCSKMCLFIVLKFECGHGVRVATFRCSRAELPSTDPEHFVIMGQTVEFHEWCPPCVQTRWAVCLLLVLGAWYWAITAKLAARK
ncbi:hypothetical protein EJ06DRAFT_300695 [Trichodelitschia bisporula]|uniref:Uncharacterized protein n=1 Tax=Trichodelitschia bisporula TaxID=703511 RepID=A0A6G1I6Z9_9PEZI|nr:hypothetical protein EJ06DRAFT_300695 [Trichodelitschia bisporula]